MIRRVKLRGRARLVTGSVALALAGSASFAGLTVASPGQTGQSQAPSVVQELVRDLGVLRRPQTAAARKFNHGLVIRLAERNATVDRRLTREVNLGEGIRVWLYVESSTKFGAPGGLGISERQPQGGSGSCCMSPELVRRRGPFAGIAYASVPHPHQAYVEVVPDGVARARWIFPRHPIEDPRLGTFAHPLIATVTVHENLAATVLPDRGAAQTVLWYDTRGRLISRHKTSAASDQR